MPNATEYLQERGYISVKEAARYLDVTYQFLWERLGTKDGPPAQKIGSRWKLPKEEFLKWAKQPVIR